MNHRSTYALFCTAVVFLALVLLFDRSPTPGKKSADLVFPGLSADNVREITLTTGKFQTVLSKSFSGWRCAYLENGKEMLNDYADRKRIQQLLDEFTTLQPSTPAFEISEQDWAGYGLGSMEKARGDSIHVEYGASRHTLYLGNSKKRGALSLVYARRDENTQLLEIDSRICQWLNDTRVNPDSMRTDTCFHLLGDISPELLLWQNKGEKSIFRHTENGWLFGDGERASNKTCQRLVEAMRRMRIFQFRSPDFFTSENLSGHNYRLLGYKNAESEEYVIIGPPLELKANAGLSRKISCNCAGRGFFYGDELKIEYGYLITSTSLKQVPLRREEFNAPELLPFSPTKAERIIRKGSKNWQADYKKDRWEVSIPRQGQLDFREVQDFLQTLGALNADAFARDVKLPAFTQSLTLEFPPGQIPEKIEIMWSEAAVPGLESRAVKLKGERTVRLLKAAKIELLAKNYTDFYCKRADVFNFSLAIELEVIRPDCVYRICKREGDWRLQEPIEALANKEHVEEILRNCAWIMAKGVMAEESERDRYGCLNANYQLKIRTKSDENSPVLLRKIEIGNDLENGYCAIWISDFPYVYKVKSDLKEAVKRELRNKR